MQNAKQQKHTNSVIFTSEVQNDLKFIQTNEDKCKNAK